MKFQKGDQYVHYTKYGGINKGEVKEIHKIIYRKKDINYGFNHI